MSQREKREKTQEVDRGKRGKRKFLTIGKKKQGPRLPRLGKKREGISARSEQGVLCRHCVHFGLQKRGRLFHTAVAGKREKGRKGNFYALKNEGTHEGEKKVSHYHLTRKKKRGMRSSILFLSPGKQTKPNRQKGEIGHHPF